MIGRRGVPFWNGYFFESYVDGVIFIQVFFVQSWPLPVISRVITPLIWVKKKHLPIFLRLFIGAHGLGSRPEENE